MFGCLVFYGNVICFLKTVWLFVFPFTSPAHRKAENGPKAKPIVDAQELWKRKVPQRARGRFRYKVLQVLSTEVRSDPS